MPLVTPAAHQHAPASPAKGAAAATASAGPEPGSRRRGTCWGCASAATDSPRPAPPCPLDAGCLLAQLGAGGALSVPVFTGSPRVLLLRQALPPAKWLALTPLLADGAECRLHYQVGRR